MIGHVQPARLVAVDRCRRVEAGNSGRRWRNARTCHTNNTLPAKQDTSHGDGADGHEIDMALHRAEKCALPEAHHAPNDGPRYGVILGYCATDADTWARGGASASAAAMTSLLWNVQTGEARAVPAERAAAASPAHQLCAV
ncbi:hypothetical protein HPB47_003849 [Ixodes persulcatus]|uniref:Uncharacterized protein n=1 Tax=Ixodes persulcatus TaxID=34615 RepID=A0AC60PHH9_IXOPE|nr:hypothetical protein HPB47_003849 [Ixodes persulcatus]